MKGLLLAATLTLANLGLFFFPAMGSAIWHWVPRQPEAPGTQQPTATPLPGADRSPGLLESEPVAGKETPLGQTYRDLRTFNVIAWRESIASAYVVSSVAPGLRSLGLDSTRLRQAERLLVLIDVNRHERGDDRADQENLRREAEELQRQLQQLLTQPQYALVQDLLRHAGDISQVEMKLTPYFNYHDADLAGVQTLRLAKTLKAADDRLEADTYSPAEVKRRRLRGFDPDTGLADYDRQVLAEAGVYLNQAQLAVLAGRLQAEASRYQKVKITRSSP